MIRSRSNHRAGGDADAPLDPVVQAELDALDAALRGEAITDETLAALVRDVQAQAPVLPDDLRRRLRHDVAEGFPRRGVLRRAGLRRRADGAAGPSWSLGRVALASGGLGAVVVAIVAVGIGLSQLNSAGSEDSLSSAPLESVVTGSSAVESASSASPIEPSDASPAVTPQSSSAGVAADAAAPEPSSARSAQSTKQADTVQLQNRFQSSAGRSTPASGPRHVERSVDMRVRVKSGQLDEAAGKVGAIVRQAGGYVADSQVSSRTRGAGDATFTLKVRTSKLDTAIARLSDLGTVTSQQQQSRDITSSFDSVQSRLSDATQVRRALLRALAKAQTAGEIASLRARIADNRQTRASLDAQLARLRQRADLTTIDLALVARSSGAAALDDDGSWSLGDAARDTVRILGLVTGALLVGAGALLPLALLGAGGYAVYRVRRRRGREAALNG